MVLKYYKIFRIHQSHAIITSDKIHCRECEMLRVDPTSSECEMRRVRVQVLSTHRPTDLS